jgi:glycosyltransferase involved in cell wall biosynthesis
MKVKYTTDLFSSLGGCQLQQANWKIHLEKSGVKISTSDNYNDFDLVHSFPILRPEKYLEFIDVDKPLVVSTNFWTDTKTFRKILFYCANKLLNIPLTSHKLVQHNARYRLFKGADRLIANSDAEKSLLVKLFSLEASKIEIIRNSVSAKFINAAEPSYQKRDHIVQIGSVSPRKGQIFAAELAKQLDTRLVIIGTIMDKEYFSKIIQDYGNRIHYAGNLENGSAEMLDYIDSALASVLLSSWETPGLVNLEAASRGVPIITTEIGGAREYLGDYAFYIEQSSRIDYTEIISFITNDYKQVSRRRHALQYNYMKAAGELKTIYNSLVA